MKKSTSRAKPISKDYALETLKYCQEVVSTILKENNLADYKVMFSLRNEEVEKGRETLMRISVDNEYLNATIYVYKPFVEMYKDRRYQEMTEYLCHEISHLRFDCLYEIASSRWGNPDALRVETERLTELYGRMMHRVMNLENKFDKHYGTTASKKIK